MLFLIEVKMSSIKPFLSWIIWFLVTSFYIFQYVLRVSPSIMMSDIMEKYHVDAHQFGIFSGAYYLGYALMHIPIGVFLDRIGAKKVVSLSVLISIVGLLPLMMGHCWMCAILGRFLVGAGSSGAILGVFNVIRLYFPERWFSRLLGVSVTLGLLGAIYGGRPVHELIMMSSWQQVLQYFVIAGALLASLVFILTPKSDTALPDHLSVKSEIKEVLANKKVMLTALFAALMVGPLEGFADVWGVSFFQVVYGMERAKAASLPSLIFLGMCAGSLILPAIAEKFKIYRQIVLTSAMVMAGLFFLLLFSRLHSGSLQVVMFCTGVFSAYQILAIYLNSLNAPAAYSSLVTAITNMVIMSFGYVFHSAIGMVMTWVWDGAIKGSVPVYQSESYIYGLFIIPVALLVSFIGFVRLGYLESRVK
jgi:MFS family permease